jgi:hypothetical protein
MRALDRPKSFSIQVCSRLPSMQVWSDERKRRYTVLKTFGLANAEYDRPQGSYLRYSEMGSASIGHAGVRPQPSRVLDRIDCDAIRRTSRTSGLSPWFHEIPTVRSRSRPTERPTARTTGLPTIRGNPQCGIAETLSAAREPAGETCRIGSCSSIRRYRSALPAAQVAPSHTDHWRPGKMLRPED